MSEIWFRTGEATVLAADGQYTDAMPEVLIGSTRGPVGQAFAGMMGQVQGHTRMFVVRDLNQLVRPSTMMTTKATIHTVEYVNLLGGVVQAATGDAIVDCVIEGILPKDGLDDLCMIIMIWLDPALRRGRQSRPEGPLPHQLRSDEARHRPRHQGRADHRRAHRQPQDGEALRARGHRRVLRDWGWGDALASFHPPLDPVSVSPAGCGPPSTGCGSSPMDRCSSSPTTRSAG